MECIQNGETYGELKAVQNDWAAHFLLQQEYIQISSFISPYLFIEDKMRNVPTHNNIKWEDWREATKPN